MYQILSESTGFCRRYNKKHFGVFFGLQCIMLLSVPSLEDLAGPCSAACLCATLPPLLSDWLC